MITVPATLPRHAFSARDAARAGDVWRLCQEIAVEASSRSGWPPGRYRDEGTAFVVRSMCVRHGLEASFGEPLTGTTWVSRMRRQMLSTREVRVRSARGEIAAARQEWAHVSAALEPARASPALLEAFPEEPSPEGDRRIELDPVAHPVPARPPHLFSFRAWWTWMDPLDHVNHPAYVDFCDEAIACAAHAAGLSPLAIAAVAEEVSFRGGIVAGEDVTVQSVPLGWTAAGAAVIAHEVRVGDRVAARSTTVRRLAGEEGPSALVDAIR